MPHSNEVRRGTARVRPPLTWRLAARARAVVRLFKPIDDFDWRTYHLHYREEIAANSALFTEDLRRIDIRVLDGRLYIVADAKPLNATHRCVYEAVLNLPGCDSIAEIGAGGGRFIANLRVLLGDRTRYAAYDISAGQLDFFRQQYPEAFASTKTAVLDITERAIPDVDIPDVVFASTVLMHIQRPDAYRRALRHFVASARKYAVLMDNYNSHDYFRDLRREFPESALYAYDSGANLAIVIDTGGGFPGPRFAPLTSSNVLGKYLREYRWGE
jgi:hypothetical protein